MLTDKVPDLLPMSRNLEVEDAEAGLLCRLDKLMDRGSAHRPFEGREVEQS